MDPLNLSSTANLLGQIDTIAPANGATLAMTYGANGPGALVYHDDPYNPTGKGSLPNGGTGSRVVYAAFGMEGVSSDVYSPIAALPADPFFVPPVIPRNPRPEMMHNIICYLRTGFVSGNVTQTAGSGPGAGQGVVGATVYLIPASGTPPPTRAVFSTLSGAGGQFTISGVEPGVYTLATYKTGYSHGASNTGVVYDVEGDVNVNTGTGADYRPAAARQDRRYGQGYCRQSDCRCNGHLQIERSNRQCQWPDLRRSKCGNGDEPHRHLFRAECRRDRI